MGVLSLLFDPRSPGLTDFLTGLYDRADHHQRRYAEAKAARALAQREYDAAKARGDTRALHTAGKALRAATRAELQAELAVPGPRSGRALRAKRTSRAEVPR